jgi:serine/threonine-protein kinase RsbW
MKTAVPSKIELRVPRRAEFVRFARNAARNLALQVDFTLADAKDIELAVGEACANAVEHVENPTCDEIVVRFIIERERLGVEIVDRGQGFDMSRVDGSHAESGEVGGLGFTVMRAVMDELDVECSAETGTCVRMAKYRMGREE